MSIVMKLQHLSRLVAVSILLPLVCACYDYDTYNDTDNNNVTATTPQMATANQYINLTITVSSGSGDGTTRAPLGGEDGDGREAGFARENFVEGITLMLYEDEAGINTTSTETKLAFVRYFPVVKREPSTKDKVEVTYTTGDHSLENSGLDLSKSYHAIVVANADLTSEFNTESTVKTVRDHTLTKIYDGDVLKADAKNFVMSLERDYEIDFKANKNKTTTTNGKTYYNFDDIYIERLAARVDFWTKNATYNDKDYTTPGYVYTATNKTDKFVLTHVTPFNLYNAEEYLLKRTNDTRTPYLDKETTTNYVVDPEWGNKTTDEAADAAYYANPLSALVVDETSKTDYRQDAMSLHNNAAQKAPFTDDGGHENFILCYPKENTLKAESPLYYYATGLCIEGYYYKAGKDEPEHRVYYGYLRHQGENEGDGTYTIVAKDGLDKEATGKENVAMNFGVVRNNIYRISIEEVKGSTEEEKPSIKLQIKVKKWDTFTHDIIYM